jgi:hypothetical protein
LSAAATRSKHHEGSTSHAARLRFIASNDASGFRGKEINPVFTTMTRNRIAVGRSSAKWTLFCRLARYWRALRQRTLLEPPNEPLNGCRGLILLERAGLIKLTPGKG